MRFMVIVKATEESEAGVMPSEELLTAMGQYNEELVKAGVMLAGDGLQASSKGARVRFAGSERTVIDGPFTETKELIAGYWIFQVKSLEEAIEWVKRCPNPHDEDCEIEIRQVFEAEDFGRVAPLPRRGGRRPPGDRRGLEDRVGAAHRGPRALRARRRAGGGPRPGRARGGARAVAGVGRPGQPGRLAHGHGQAPCHRPVSPQRAARAQAGGAGARARAAGAGRRPGPRRRARRPDRGRPAAPRLHLPATRSSRRRRAWRSPCACSAV